MEYRVADVSRWELRGVEQRGVTSHDWLVEPATGVLHLWKPAEGRRLQRREHWAELVAGELAVVLGVPSAHIQLAVRDGVVGCLSRDLVAHGEDVVPGAHLLSNVDPAFDPEHRGHRSYTVMNVHHVLHDKVPPLELPGVSDAFDAFAGYLAFDALVLNRDRHAANWMVLRQRDGSGPDRLSPLYDNASALVLSMGESRMSRITGSGGVGAYVARECAARPFAPEAGRPATLFEVAADAMELCSPAAREHWRERVSALAVEDVTVILLAVPGMSEVVRTFCAEVIRTTREELLRAVAP